MYCLRSPNVISSLSNKLDQRGHLISFFMPKITIHKLSHFNIHLHLISFIPFSRLQWTSLSLSLKFLSESSYLMVFYDFIHREMERPYCDYLENQMRNQELLLGFELTGMPFLAASKPPTGAETL
ncbi:hypothetical protein Lal_00041313, partial [Lupinus albus]